MNIKLLTALHQSIQHSPVKQVKIEIKGFKISLTREDPSQPPSRVFFLLPRSTESTNLTVANRDSRDKLQKRYPCHPNRILQSIPIPKTKKQYVKLRDTIGPGDVVGTINSLGTQHEVISEH